MLVRISVLSAFLFLVLIAAGCGGGGSSSVETSSGYPGGESVQYPKEAFIAEADALCSDYQAKAKPIRDEIETIERAANPESPQNLVRLGELLNESIAEAEANLESIRELEPPKADEATIEKMLNSAQEGNGLGAEAGKALEEGKTLGFGKRAKDRSRQQSGQRDRGRLRLQGVWPGPVSRWETTATLDTEASLAAVWEKAYVDPAAWPSWNRELKRAVLDRPLAMGAEAKIAFRTGLRLRFRVVEFEDGRLFTDEARLPGARMGHRHLVEPTATGSRLTNTIYIEGPLAGFWRRILGPAAARSLPGAQQSIADLALAPPPAEAVG